jgi:hypothetical protein
VDHVDIDVHKNQTHISLLSETPDSLATITRIRTPRREYPMRQSTGLGRTGWGGTWRPSLVLDKPRITGYGRIARVIPAYQRLESQKKECI